ncbi:hypothetical protein SAZ10_29810 [Mesorhizobium sp. BAC0120]|uniref:hypothetical protein n=1 Tax=Mesorhizobium sp. BAC0120 TaxID=3090670 RepID=UPI00298CF827|nr:hypothetical protein [Mesorhizobium sp. BAC0120]MDW6025962.1 hypothetical protein [Mesorhizobium sp. BAC0120]
MSGAPAVEAAQSFPQEICSRVQSILKALDRQYGESLPESKRDVLLATYLFGLTAVIFADDAPDIQLAAIQASLESAIPPARAAAALDAVPEDGDAWFLSALERVEAIGSKHGHELAERGAGAARVIPFSSKHSSTAASAEPAAVDRNAGEEVLIP